jgi:hypothetical protein
MTRMLLVAGAVVGLSACQGEGNKAQKRAELRQLGGNKVEIVPAEGQLPYCLVFTRSANGVLRQLTMTHENKSLRCPAGEPVGHVSYRIPVEEGEVTALVFFSDQKLNAGSVGQQLYEMPRDQRFSPMNLRLPGQVNVEAIAFQPQQDTETAVGGVVGAGGMVEGAGQAEGGSAAQATPPTAADEGGAPDAPKQ